MLFEFNIFISNQSKNKDLKTIILSNKIWKPTNRDDGHK